MMQTQWPGLGTSFDFSSLETSLAGDDGSVGTAGGFARAQTPDGVARPWWGPRAVAGNDNGGNQLGGLFGPTNTANGSIAGILTGLVSMLQQLVSSFLNQNQSQPQNQSPTPWQNQPCAQPGAQQQRFADVDVSSTGDPHLAAVGTREGGGAPVDDHWDSMTSQNDLVHSTQIDGGYRVSTAVTQAGTNGVTSNQSATVHANFDQDAVTMNRDGSFGIYDNGQEVRLGKGESAVLSGGETVSENQDGSLLVSARSATGGSIATTLRATGAGVDVTTHAHEIAVGGEAVAHAEHGHGHARPHHEPRVVQKTAPMMPPAP
jgi:hypothetical protein